MTDGSTPFLFQTTIVPDGPNNLKGGGFIGENNLTPVLSSLIPVPIAEY